MMILTNLTRTKLLDQNPLVQATLHQEVAPEAGHEAEVLLVADLGAIQGLL